jgi:hypothetical protein
VRRKVVVLESCDADNLIRNEIQFRLSDYFFFLHQNQNIFFSNIGNQNILLEKKHNPPFKLNGRSLINTKNTKVPAHYYVGCRLGQILHARLRMNCCALNTHLFIRNLVESPNCICGITETVSHFLLDCPRHTTLRQQLFFSLLDIPETISLNLLIFDSQRD